jgi:hypothetical protein
MLPLPIDSVPGWVRAPDWGINLIANSPRDPTVPSNWLPVVALLNRA